MTLLDIIIDPLDTFRSHPRPVVPDTIIPETVLPADTTDSVAATANMIGGNQQIADIAPHPSIIADMAGNEFFWALIVVIVALSLCFYFVRKYRKTV